MDALRSCLAWNHNRVGIYRWEYSNFKTTTYQTMEEWVLSRTGLVSRHNQNDKYVEFPNGSRLCYGGLKPSESAAGDLLKVVKSLEHSTIYIDEVTDIPEKVFDFLPTRIGRIRCQWALNGKWEKPSGRVRCTCNPELGWVKTRFVDRPAPGYAFIRATVHDNAENLSEDYIPTLLRSRDPDWVRRYVEGDWSAAVDAAAMYPAELLYRAVACGDSYPDGIVEFGVDVGAEGDDLSVIMMRRGGYAELLWEGHTPNTMDLVGRTEAYADRLKPRLVKVDSIGVGKGAYDALARDGYPVMPMIGGARPEDEMGNYRNQRAEIYWHLRKLLQEGRVNLPDFPEMVNELGSIRYSQTASGKTIQVESKTEIKKRLGRSPDRADALVYAFAYSEPGFSAIVL